MIHFVTGKPRGGKSLYGMRQVLDELVYGVRPVITNLPINLGALNSYIQTKYPWAKVDIFRRIRFLDDAQCKKFFLYRGYDAAGVEVNVPDTKLPLDYSSGAVFGPVLYVIDEIHLFFNAREFADTGKACLWYVSQHGKLGDDLIAITQFVGNVDRQFRVLAQDFTAVRNLANEKFGMFRLPGVFTRRVYQEVPTPSSTPTETSTFQLDLKGIASCYNTAQGVGIMGRGDMGRRKKGIPWYYSILLAAAVIALLIITPHYLIKGISRAMVYAAGGANFTGAVPVPSAVATNQTAMPGTNAMSQTSIPDTVPAKKQDEPEKIYVTGYTQLGDQHKIYLSNNTVYNSRQVSKIIGNKLHFYDGVVALNDPTYKPKEQKTPTVNENFIMPARVMR